MASTHNALLPRRDRLFVNLDEWQPGLGSYGCGPGPLPEYELRPEPFGFALAFVPLAHGSSRALHDLARRAAQEMN